MTADQAGVVLLHQQYGPYHVARARALETRLRGRVHFVQLASNEQSHPWEVADSSPHIRTVLPGAFEQLAGAKLASRLGAVLDTIRPDVVVIAGYAVPAMREAARWCRRHDAASILLCDSHHVDRPRVRFKEWAKRVWISRHFQSAFTAGASSAAYARDLGFATSQIWRGYDVVDNAFFEQAATAGRARGQLLFRKLGLPEHVFLYVGRFNHEKNLDGLLDAMQAYRRRSGARAWGLLLVGDGPEREALEERVRSVQPGVAMTGFKQASELAELYGAASGFILPSLSEPWGLVINEAMAAGLPILASDRVGAMFDLVFPGINGYVFNPESRDDMVEAMLRLSSDQVDREAMGKASRRLVAGYTPETWAAALTDCIEVTVARRRERRGNAPSRHVEE
jgi:glycosyltransferase involved in cell wall biosynthesis